MSCVGAEVPEGFGLESWVTADQHWGHGNIVRLQSRPVWHESLMIRNWHALVGAEDWVLCLGDIVVFPRGDTARARWFAALSALPGRKLLLRGNHDREPDSWYGRAGFTVLGRRPLLWGDPGGGPASPVLCFSHESALDDGAWTANLHGHSHSSVPAEDARRRRLNCCVEVRGYAPWRVREVLAGRRDTA